MPDEPPPGFDPAKSISVVMLEYAMAVETATRAHPILRTSIESSSDDDYYSAVAFVESFFVHARCLDEFLSSRGKFPSDVKAAHFVSGFSETPLDPELLESINHALQHITVERQEGHLPWVPMDHLRPIAESMGRFIEQLAGNQPDLAIGLARVHDKAIKTLASPPPPKANGTPTSAPWFSYSPPTPEDGGDADEGAT